MAFLIFSLTGCHVKSDEEHDELTIIVTIKPYKGFVEEIAGENVNIEVMVPPGVSPHTYEPSPQLLASVSRADMYVLVGSGIEFEQEWFPKINEINKDMHVINSSEGIPLSKDIDPHVWTSPENVILIAENIFKGLVKIDNENKAFYEKNKENFTKRLEELDNFIRENTKENQMFLVKHPAWGHFAKSYNLKQLSIEHEGKEPTAKNIEHIVETAKKHNISIVFASPQFSTKSAETISKEIDGKVALVDPLAIDYINNMKNVTLAFSGYKEP